MPGSFSRGRGSRTPIDGFGDRSPTIRGFPFANNRYSITGGIKKIVKVFKKENFLCARAGDPTDIHSCLIVDVSGRGVQVQL